MNLPYTEPIQSMMRTSYASLYKKAVWDSSLFHA